MCCCPELFRRWPDALCGSLQSSPVQVVWGNGDHHSGAWETGSWKGRDDSAASLPVYTAAAWDRHVQPKYSRACGSAASESGSCQRQGTVGKRTQNWRYSTCGHGNIDCSYSCDEPTELTRLMFSFRGQKSIGQRLFHYQTPCNLCLYRLSVKFSHKNGPCAKP